VVNLSRHGGMLIRVFLGWLRGEPRHCKMVAIPPPEDEMHADQARERASVVEHTTPGMAVTRRQAAGADAPGSVVRLGRVR
jgi:hypothetical protein